MKKIATLPTSNFAKRLASVMHRKHTTHWNLKTEIRPFRVMCKGIDEEDLGLIERYYRKNWPPRTSVNHLRHDLATLINNWQGEVDRARIWCDAHHLVRKIIPLPPLPSVTPPLQTAEPEVLERFMQEFAERKARKAL